MIRIFTDFNTESLGKVPIDFPASLKDIEKQGVDLIEGLRVLVYDDSFEMEAVVEKDQGKWHARLIEGTGRDIPGTYRAPNLDLERQLFDRQEKTKGSS